MELSSLILRVLLLFFPGVVCAVLVDVLTVRRGRNVFQFLTHSYVLGMGSYLLVYGARELWALLAALFGLRPPLEMTFFTALVDERQRIAWGEIALAGLTSVPLAVAVAAIREWTMEKIVPRFQPGNFRKGGLKPEIGVPPQDFHPAPMGIPFQTPGLTMANREIPPLREGTYDKGGRNWPPFPPRPDVRPARWGSRSRLRHRLTPRRTGSSRRRSPDRRHRSASSFRVF